MRKPHFDMQQVHASQNPKLIMGLRTVDLFRSTA